jgi:hypothetical protein
MFQDQGPIRLCHAPVGEHLWAICLPCVGVVRPAPAGTAPRQPAPQQLQIGVPRASRMNGACDSPLPPRRRARSSHLQIPEGPAERAR